MSSVNATQFERARGVTQVRAVGQLSHVAVTLTPEERLALLRRLSDAAVPVLLTTLTEDGLSFIVRAQNEPDCRYALEQAGSAFQLHPDKTLVSVIAGAMRDLSGVIAQIYDALHEEKINIWQTGDAYDAVHVLVDSPVAERARVALEKRFPVGGGV